MTSLTAIYRVWLRYLAVFRKDVVYGLVTTFVEPLLYLASFGFGLGGMIGNIHVGKAVVSYRAFVLAGIAGQTLLLQAFFDAAYGSFVRMYYQKIFQAISVTPVTLSEVLWGELIWDSSRATLSAFAVYLVGILIGDFRPESILFLVPLSFLFALIFASIGLFVAARSPTIDAISYPNYLFVIPMFLFAGVFFPLANLPGALRTAISFLPLTPVISFVRTLALGFPFEPVGIPIVLAWAAITIPFARRAMMRRLIPR